MKTIDKEIYLYAKLRYFQHIYDQSEAVYEHPPDRGGPREEAVRDYLKAHLPRKYGVTTGKILNQSGELTRQIDIIIYDALNCPILYSERIGKEYQIIPSESVVGTVEVKSTLTETAAGEIIKNTKSILEVTNTDKITSSFFCYAPPIFKEEKEIDAYCQTIQKHFSNNKFEKILKIGCVLPSNKNHIKGRIMKKDPCFFFMPITITLDKTITKGKEKKLHNYPVFAEGDPEVLLAVFMSRLSDELNKWTFKKYSILKYMISFGKNSK